MTASVMFIADPPQSVRYNALVGPSGWVAVIGDRLSESYSSGQTTTYECTTGGATVGGFSPVGANPYNWGSSVWTQITPTSWANAATILYGDMVNYIDANAHHVAPSRVFTPHLLRAPIAVVFVDPATMLPTTGRIPYNVTEEPVAHFGLPATGGYHCRPKFGYAPSGYPSVPVVDGVIDSTLLVDSFRRMRGVTFNPVSTGTNSWTWRNDGGVAINVNVPPNVSSITCQSFLNTAGKENSEQFGIHLEHVLGSTVLPSPSYLTSQGLLWAQTLAYVSDNNFAATPWTRGMQSAISRADSTYRDGAASAPDTNHSYLFGGQGRTSPGALRVSPQFFIHNNLTGARTLKFRFLTDSPWENDITNADAWIEVFYPSSGANAKYSLITTEAANWGVPACSKSMLTVDSATWTYNTIYYPTAWRIDLSFSPQRVGFILLRFVMASRKLGSAIVFLDPFVEIV